MSKITWEENGNGCWICTSHKPNKDGYYDITRNGKKTKIHRVLYEAFTGVAIDEVTIIRHTCDTPECINPNHLIHGTHEDNVSDRVERGRSAKGKDNGRSKLTDEQVRFIIENELKYSDAELSRFYGVTRRVFYDIRRGNTWKHLTKNIDSRYVGNGNRRRTERANARITAACSGN